jgi:effector-binding domain-containing protein
MQIKSVKPINFLFYRTETRVAGLANLTWVARDLFKEAVAQDLTVTGPVHWHYFGFCGDESKDFTLEIAIPIADIPQEYDGRFHFKRTEPFRCVATTHEGSWFEIPKTYGKLMEFITMQKLAPNAINRELYVNADFKDPDANVTEIQIGIS